MGTANTDGWRRWRVPGARGLSLLALIAGAPRDALAGDTATVGFSVGIERLFGQTWVERRFDTPSGPTEQQFDSFDLFAAQTPHEGYSSPRVAADALFDFGLTLGGAVGYHGVSSDGDSASVWVLAPRAGYLWRFSPWVGLWPRAGVTWLALDGDADFVEDELAVTLELPLVILVAQRRLGLLLEPYVELGLPGGDIDLDERGVQVGATVFF